MSAAERGIERSVHLQRVQRPGPMAQQVLLLGGQLRQPPSVGELEHRVESETVRTARLRRDAAGEHTLTLECPSVRQGQHRDAVKGCRWRTAGGVAEGGEQGADQGRTIAVVLLAGEVRGLYARSPAEQRHL